MSRMARWVIMGALLAGTLSCSADHGGEDNGSCTAGEVGCACLPDGAGCTSGGYCADNVCRPVSCTIGDLNCACHPNSTCNQNDGAWLMCQSGLCGEPPCTQGELGCGCLPTGTCLGGAVCAAAEEGGSPVCQPPDCTVGDENCLCKPDRTCNEGSKALLCDGQVCVASDCEPGEAGCGCKPNYACNGPKLTCDEDLRCSASTCAPGALNCGCADGGCSDSSLYCAEDGVCRPATCVQGDEGCGCLSDYKCNPNPVGGVLLCKAGTCIAPECPQGDLSCACLFDGTCLSDEAVCVEGTCIKSACEAPGALHCPCKPGATCDAGLVCQGGLTCVQNTGNTGGACFGNLTCNAGNKCEQGGELSPGECVACDPGSNGCSCFGNNACLAGLICHLGTCTPEEDIVGEVVTQTVITDVAQAPCYTPCNAGFQKADGGWVPCSADGLAEACIQESTAFGLQALVCKQGSCAPPGPFVKPACETELDCPDFQACLHSTELGYAACFSQCEYDSECPGETRCHRKVCREQCNTTDAPCAKGYSCNTVDGENGFCALLPTAPPDGPTEFDGTFTTSVPRLNVNPDTPTSGDSAPSFDIVNDSNQEITIEVRKLKHTVYDAEGSDVTCAFIEDAGGCQCAGAQHCLETSTPLHWLTVSDTLDQSFQVTVPAKGSTTITIGAWENETYEKWEGVIRLTHIAPAGVQPIGMREVAIGYSEGPEARWAGRMYYFANFRDEGMLDAAGNPKADLSNTKNAFVDKWSQFLTDPQATYDEFVAMLSATQSGSWAWSSVDEVCQANKPGAVCFLYDNSQGYVVYSQNLAERTIPTGVVELPVAMNLKRDGSETAWGGRIVTADSLHYGGEPAVALTVEAAPTCSKGACLRRIQAFSAQIHVGGRFLPTGNGTGKPQCRDGEGTLLPGFEATGVPWLVPGFLQNTILDDETQRRYRYECRSEEVPYSDVAEAGTTVEDINASFSAANPVPDGRTRRRTLRLIDGAVINEDTIFIIFQERFESFLTGGDEDLKAYGYMVLSKNSLDLDPEVEPEAFEGQMPTVGDEAEAATVLAGCSEDLLERVLGAGAPTSVGELSTNEAETVARAMVTGFATPDAPSLKVGAGRSVHYLCEDTGLLDQGELGDAGPVDPTSCPAGSRVIFFVLDDPVDGGTSAEAFVGAAACQKSGSCHDTLMSWEEAGTANITLNPIYVCESQDEVLCDKNRVELRDHKAFYDVPNCLAPERDDTCDADGSPPAVDALFNPFLVEQGQAFRYKTKFKNRHGTNLGFTPEQCVPGSDAIPYCYDPTSIESLRERADCAASVYQHFRTVPGFDVALAATLLEHLQRSFGFAEVPNPQASSPDILEGFEWLYAELLVMLGDEAFTDAFAARFDLAGAALLSFEGDKFEPGGILLSGVAGYEMYRLYQAAQYYQLVVDRFFSLTEVISGSMTQSSDPEKVWVGMESVTAWLPRIVRASAQKSRAWSEIAERYQAFGKTTIARRVIERAYTAAYMESVILAQVMRGIARSLEASELPQIEREIETAQLNYRSALLRMRDVYAGITDTQTIFGFEEDYVPFPALDPADPNSFEKVFARARQKALIAGEKEDLAIASNKSYETDSAAFQSELVKLRNSFENELADICGTFVGVDNNVYPAIPRYAQLHPNAAIGNPDNIDPQVGDMCGLVGNGLMYEEMIGFENAELRFEAIELSQRNIVQRIRDEEKRVQQQCDKTLSIADYELDLNSKIKNLEDAIRGSNDNIEEARDGLNVGAQLANLAKCSVLVGTSSGGDCIKSVVAAIAYKAVVKLQADKIKSEKEAIDSKEKEIDKLQLQAGKWKAGVQCDMLQIDSQANVQDLWRELEEMNLGILQADYDNRLALARIQGLRNKATRLIAEQQETEQLTINIEAARNNPNVRIYKNDDILNAERTFEIAVREAYRATRVYEYFTSTSYAAKEELQLVRLVSHGDIHLEGYLDELEEAFYEFEELYGLPDLRVAIVSARDDILGIPELENGKPLPMAARIEAFRERLRDPELIDRFGYVTLPFATSLGTLSPLTRNHKLDYVEAELVGSGTGDTIGRVYLRQKGTATVQRLQEFPPKEFFAFPSRTAVINTFFNGVRVFEPDYYRNTRFKERPFANTHWELVINQHDESENQDIDLKSLTDIRLYLFYRDFTVSE